MRSRRTCRCSKGYGARSQGRGLALAAGLLLSGLGASRAAADVEGVNAEQFYEIVYTTSDTSTQTVANAKIVDVVRIGSVEFLVIEPGGVSGVSRGYLSLPHVRAILPGRKFQQRDE